MGIKTHHIDHVEEYRRWVKAKIDELLPLFGRSASGDVPDIEEIPDEESEFADLYEGLRLLVSHLQEKEQELNELKETLEDKASEKYRNLAAIVESNDDAIIGKSINGLITSWNKGAESVYGFTKDEMLNEPVLKIIPDEKVAEHEKIMDNIRQGRQVKHFETLRQTKSGARIHVSVTISPILDDEGKAIGASSISRDISEKVRILSALQKSEEKYRNLVENMNEGVVLVDNEDRIGYVNEEFCEITGYDEEELIGSTDYELLLGGNEKKKMQKRMEVRKEGGKGKYEISIQTKSGEKKWLLISGTPMYDENGEVRGSMGLHTDITTRKHYEEEVRMLYSVISQTDNAIVIADPTGKIEWVNKGFEQLTGFSQVEVKGTAGTLLRKGKNTGLVKNSKHFQNLLEMKQPISYESKNFTKNGTPYWAYTTLTPILNEEGEEVSKIVAIDSNITEKKKIEKELRKAKIHAEQSSRSKEQFLANMSHEIRTPMNAIMGMAQLLEDTPLTEEQQEYLRSINFGAENLLRIINDVLDLSKIEAGKVSIEKARFNLRDLLKSLTASLKYRVGDNVEMKLEVDESLPNDLKGDHVRLNQILLNLVGNSLKFTNEGEVVLKVVKSGESDKNGRIGIQFEIHDTGIGIPKSKKEKIFRAFEQLDNRSSREFGGSGLGLAIVKRLVDLQKGSIDLESIVGEGTSFYVNLDFGIPTEKADDVEKPDIPMSSLSQLKGKRILLVEDNQLNQMVAEKMLIKWGLEVDVAINGREALEKIQQDQNFDLIFMDVQMPEMDGYEATRKIRDNIEPPCNKIPIIAMTAHAIRGEDAKCKQAGMDDYIPKPFGQEDLKEKLLSYLINR